MSNESNENHKTIADIVAEMRECADRMEKRGLFDLRGCGTDYLRALADLLEAAWTREREAGAAAAQACGEIGEMLGREAACKEVTDCNRLGNAAKMREALDSIYQKLETLDVEADSYADEVIASVKSVIVDALSAPPRNCDVGTAAEQEKRMNEFCNSHKHGGSVYACENCELLNVDRCELAWSQMPHEEGGAK